MDKVLNLKKHIPKIRGCKKCDKKTKQTHKETEKLHIYKCTQCNNVEWDKKDMNTIKLTEADLTKIVKRIVNESKPKVSSSFEPAERNIGKKIDFVPPTEKKPSLYDREVMRKEITQKVVDRIMKYGEKYVNEINKINYRFPIKKNPIREY